MFVLVEIILPLIHLIRIFRLYTTTDYCVTDLMQKCHLTWWIIVTVMWWIIVTDTMRFFMKSVNVIIKKLCVPAYLKKISFCRNSDYIYWIISQCDYVCKYIYDKRDLSVFLTILLIMPSVTTYPTKINIETEDCHNIKKKIISLFLTMVVILDLSKEWDS